MLAEVRGLANCRAAGGFRTLFSSSVCGRNVLANLAAGGPMPVLNVHHLIFDEPLLHNALHLLFTDSCSLVRRRPAAFAGADRLAVIVSE